MSICTLFKEWLGIQLANFWHLSVQIELAEYILASQPQQARNRKMVWRIVYINASKYLQRLILCLQSLMERQMLIAHH
jgi:hypothetical protein